MSIRPVDLQVMIPRTSEAGRAMNNDLQRPEVLQQQFSEEALKRTQRDEQRVVDTNKSEQNSVDKDGKGHTGKQESGKKRKSSDRHTDQESKKPNATSMFDVTI